MEYSRFLDCLAADFTRLRAVAPIDLDAPVPSCPGWTVADLTRHVGEVYVHKTLAMREGAEPDQWPPEGLAQEEPLALLDRAYAGLLSEFAVRKPEESGWHLVHPGPDRRLLDPADGAGDGHPPHRRRAGHGAPVAPVPDDLAADGIDELLKVFTAFSVAEWGSYFTDILGGSPGRTYAVRTDGAAWRVRTGPGLFVVEDRTGESGPGDGSGDGTADVTVSGPPAAVLRWLWNREKAGEPSGVTVEGAPVAVEELRGCIVVATQ